MRYFLELSPPGHDSERRYGLVVIDRKRDKRWAYVFSFTEDEIMLARVDVRERWNARAVFELWAAIDIESPDTLAEAHERGWVDAFKVHAYARTHYRDALERERGAMGERGLDERPPSASSLIDSKS